MASVALQNCANALNSYVECLGKSTSHGELVAALREEKEHSSIAHLAAIASAQQQNGAPQNGRFGGPGGMAMPMGWPATFPGFIPSVAGQGGVGLPPSTAAAQASAGKPKSRGKETSAPAPIANGGAASSRKRSAPIDQLPAAVEDDEDGDGGDGEKKKKRSRITKPKDPDAPKRPQTAYLMFQQAVRNDVKASMPEGYEHKDLLAKIGNMWKNMNEEERKVSHNQTFFEEYFGTTADIPSNVTFSHTPINTKRRQPNTRKPN